LTLKQPLKARKVLQKQPDDGYTRQNGVLGTEFYITRLKVKPQQVPILQVRKPSVHTAVSKLRLAAAFFLQKLAWILFGPVFMYTRDSH